MAIWRLLGERNLTNHGFAAIPADKPVGFCLATAKQVAY